MGVKVICFYCEKEIASTQKSTIIALDVPYVNLSVHRPECVFGIDSYGREEYLRENIERVYKYAGKDGGTKVKRG